MTVKIGGKDPTLQTLFEFVKDTTKPMSGQFKTNNEVSKGKYEKASKHVMTVDLYDINDPYLEIRVAEIHYNVIELNKTSPMFLSALNQKQKVALGRDLDFELPAILYFDEEYKHVVEMNLLFKSDNTQNAIIFD